MLYLRNIFKRASLMTVGLAVDPAVPLAIVYDDLDYDETDLQDCADAIY